MRLFPKSLVLKQDSFIPEIFGLGMRLFLTHLLLSNAIVFLSQCCVLLLQLTVLVTKHLHRLHRTLRTITNKQEKNVQPHSANTTVTAILTDKYHVSQLHLIEHRRKKQVVLMVCFNPKAFISYYTTTEGSNNIYVNAQSNILTS